MPASSTCASSPTGTSPIPASMPQPHAVHFRCLQRRNDTDLVVATRSTAERTESHSWFNNVEQVAARRIGRETVQYVANIYKYYVSYSLLERQLRTREQARGATP